MFVILYLLDTKRKKIFHKLNPQKLYDEQFVIYNDDGGVAGLCGLDNIDTATQKNAELWALIFRGNPFGTVDSAIQWIEKYSANIKLDSLYAHVQLSNDKSKECLTRNNYTVQEETKDVMVSKIPFKIAPVQVFGSRMESWFKKDHERTGIQRIYDNNISYLVAFATCYIIKTH